MVEQHRRVAIRDDKKTAAFLIFARATPGAIILTSLPKATQLQSIRPRESYKTALL